MDINLNYLGLFPGQGSQKVGMGLELYEQSAIARDLFDIADKQLGMPLSEICFQGPSERLLLTEITQPAILTVSTICCRVAQEAHGGPLPLAAAAGHSLGEYSALVAAGALSFEDAVLLVHKRGRFMQEAVAEDAGKMVAVLGKDIAELEEVLDRVSSGVAEIANINAPGQIVVAGQTEAIAEFIEKLGAAKVVEIPVSAPFHTSLMKAAEVRLRKELAVIDIRSARFPVYANFSAQPVQEPEAIRAALGEQVCNRVRWVECMQNMLAPYRPAAVVEFGVGNVLSNMLKRIDSDAVRLQVCSVGDAEREFSQPSTP